MLTYVDDDNGDDDDVGVVGGLWSCWWWWWFHDDDDGGDDDGGGKPRGGHTRQLTSQFWNNRRTKVRPAALGDTIPPTHHVQQSQHPSHSTTTNATAVITSRPAAPTQ